MTFLMKNLKYSFFFLTTILLTACGAPDAPKPLSIQPVVHTAEWAVEWWGPRHEAKLLEKEQAAEPIEIVLLGDSITHGWESEGQNVWDNYFGTYQTLNLGFGGDRTEHVLWRLQNGAVDDIAPDLLMLMIGTNNTGHRLEPTGDTILGIQTILDELETRLPETDILLLAIFPRGETPDNAERLRNNAINVSLAKMTKSKRVHYRDIGAIFTQEDGTISQDIMPDLLHLSPKGYTLWAEAIKADVEKLAKQP